MSEERSGMKIALDWLGGIAAFLTVVVYVLLLIHAKWAYLPDSVYNEVKTKGYKDISDCSLYTNEESEGNCGAFTVMNNVSKIYLTTYSTTTFKNFVKDNNTFERDFREYIAYLPTYSKNTSKTPNTGYYRVIVEYVSNDTHKYGTMEVSRWER